MVAQLIDDPSNVMWSAANLDLVITLVYDQLWHRMLEHAPFLNVTSATVLAADLTSPGYFNIGTVTGLSTVRIKRLLELQIDGQVYYEGRSEDEVFTGSEIKVTEARGGYRWVRYGALVYPFPLQTSDDVLVRVSVLPTRFTAIAADSTAITWPDGHEDALVYKAAGVALGKGDKEDASRLLGLAKEAWEELRGTIGRPSSGPVMPRMLGLPENWGGE